MTEEWQTPRQVEEMVIEEPEEETLVIRGKEAGSLGEDLLQTLATPLQTRRESAAVQRLSAAFDALQANLQLLAHSGDVEADTLRVHVELLDQTRKRIEAALGEKQDAMAWGLFESAWLRFAQIVPAERYALLLNLRVQSGHAGTGTQTLVGYFEALREGAVMLAHRLHVDPATLRSYVLILEQTRPKLEAALAAGHFDHAWFLVRSLWEVRLGLLPPEDLEAERKALELLTASVGRGQRRATLDEALAEVRDEEDVSRLRSVLVWVKREINESAQARYWKFNIYERRVRLTATVLVTLLVILTAATVLVLDPGQDGWLRSTAVLVGVLLSGALGGAVSGLRTSEEISQQRISSAYFRQAVTNLRMLVGAAAALAIYFVLASGLVAIQFGSEVVQDVVHLALGFLSGFSERFFLQALDRAGAGSGLSAQPSPPVTPPSTDQLPGQGAAGPGKDDA